MEITPMEITPEELKNIKLDDYIEEEITSLEKKNNHTYDIEVENNHHYILENGIVSHNSISTIVNTSSGIEPVFGLVYTRKVEVGQKQYDTMFIVDPVFEKHINKYYKEQKEKIYQYISNNNGSCQGCKLLSKQDTNIFVTAGDIKPNWHLELLEPFANYVSLSVSKTINLPKEATKDEVSQVYLNAYKKGVIGVTVYRDGCREGILIHNNKDSIDDLLERREAPKRPTELECDMFLVKVKDEYLAILIGKLKGMLYEMFVSTADEKIKTLLFSHKEGKILKVKRNEYKLLHNDEVLINNLGKFGNTVERSLARFVSMSLRHGVPLKFIVEQLNKSDDFASFDKAVSRVLKKYIKNGESYDGDVCPECESKLIYFDGCIKCSNCIWTKCG